MSSFPSNAPYVGCSSVPFSKATKEIVESVQAMSSSQRQELLKVSDKLLHSTEKNWSLSPSEYLEPSRGLPGLFAYNGEAFKSFDVNSLGNSALQRAKKSLAIVSALYGIVTGEMNIVKYRLEMQSKLQVNGYKNLYSLWRPILTQWLNNQESGFVVNLCSREYSKVFDWKSVTIPVLHIDFKQLKDGEMKSVFTFSKQARGTMARWIFTENIQTIFSIASFDLDGYRLYSHENDNMVFLREEI